MQMEANLQSINDRKQGQLTRFALGRGRGERLQLLVDFLVTDCEKLPQLEDIAVFELGVRVRATQAGVLVAAGEVVLDHFAQSAAIAAGFVQPLVQDGLVIALFAVQPGLQRHTEGDDDKPPQQQRSRQDARVSPEALAPPGRLDLGVCIRHDGRNYGLMAVTIPNNQRFAATLPVLATLALVPVAALPGPYLDGSTGQKAILKI